jgi:hypothetical protein
MKFIKVIDSTDTIFCFAEVNNTTILCGEWYGKFDVVDLITLTIIKTIDCRHIN